MHYDGFDVIAPHLPGEYCDETDALGSAVWLCLQSDAHSNAAPRKLSARLLPAIRSRQFVLASENGEPVFFLSWASFSAEAEKRYLKDPASRIPEADLASGDRVWFLEWVAPFGHAQRLRNLMTQRLFPGWCARSLYQRDDIAVRVITFRGMDVTPEEARFWLEKNPPAFDSPLEPTAEPKHV